MKRFLTPLMCVAMSALLCMQVFAAGSAELIRTFVHEGELYTYGRLAGEDRPITKVEAKIDGQSFQASGRFQTVRQARFPITYLLLVDNSNSMPPFREDIAAFAESLAASSGENTRFMLATFGDDLQLLGEDIPGEELEQAMREIPLDERVTRLHTCIDKALDHFETLPREGTELRCLVVLSDAVQYDPTGGVPYDTLLERLKKSDVMLHSLGFGADAEAIESMGQLAQASGGIHQAVGDISAEDAAERLNETSGDLFVTSFDLTGCTASGSDQSVAVTFVSDGELLCRTETQVDIPEELASSAQKPNEQPPVDVPPSEPVTPSAPSGNGAASEPEGAGIPLLPTLAGGVIVAIAVFFLLTRKKKSSPVQIRAQMATDPEPVGAGIFMRLEVLEGQLSTSKTELELYDELFIGREQTCEIPFDSEALAPRQVRVFAEKGSVCLENLEPAAELRVNGEAINGAVVLRSGSTISVGEVKVRLKF